jgi:hypothetical protein
MDTIMSALFAVTGVIGIAIGFSGRRDIAPPPNGPGPDMRPWV